MVCQSSRPFTFSDTLKQCQGRLIGNAIEDLITIAARLYCAIGPEYAELVTGEGLGFARRLDDSGDGLLAVFEEIDDSKSHGMGECSQDRGGLFEHLHIDEFN